MSAQHDVIRLDANAIAQGLEEFEALSEQVFGAHMTTSAFYERYCAGELDNPFGMAWAVFYETYQEVGPSADTERVSRAIHELAAV